MRTIGNKLILVSGASGSGKTSLMRSIMSNELVSFTTRPPREGEIEGVDYIFITKEEFDHLDSTGGLMEKTQYGSNFYGITRNEYEEKLSRGSTFAIVDFNGMKQLKELHDNVLTIFIYADREDIRNRMIARGDKEADVEKRMSTYDIEIANLCFYNEVVTNHEDEFEETLEILRDIISEA